MAKRDETAWLHMLRTLPVQSTVPNRPPRGPDKKPRKPKRMTRDDWEEIEDAGVGDR